MNILKKLGLGLSIGLLPVMLFAFGSLTVIYQTLGKPDTIKTALDESKIYEKAIPDLLEQINTGDRPQDSKDKDQIPLSDPQVQAIIGQAFPPDYLEQQVTKFIDSTYTVVQGKSKSLDFEINLQDAKTRLAEGLGTYAAQRLATLPVCTSVTDIAPDGFDPLSATCVPPGVDKAVASQKVRDEILNSQDFLKDPVINASDIEKSQGNQLDEKLDHIARSYGLIKVLTWLTAVLAVLFAIAVVFLSISRRSGLKRVAITFISVGILGAGLAWLSTFVLGRVVEHLTKTSSNTELQARFVDVIRLVSADMRNWWIGYGLLLVGFGVGVIIGLRIMKPTEPKETSANSPAAEPKKTSPEPSTAAEPADEKPPKAAA